jgi:hypothetical protein
MHRTDLTDLTDDALVSRLSTLCAEGHVLTARLIVHLIEVEERRLDLRAACTSMFAFCQRRLGMSEGAAFRRITAARMVKRFPALLGRIERGELHLSTLVLIRPHLTEQNAEELVAAVAGKTQRQVEELLARLAPKPDVPSAIVELGAPSNDARPTLFAGPDASHVPSAPRARIEPLSEARYKVQLTASAELKAKLERARDLMRHRNPSGDLAVVIDAAMDLLLAKLEKERLGKVKAPRAPTKPRAGSGSGTHRVRAIPAGVRRAVFERDGNRRARSSTKRASAVRSAVTWSWIMSRRERWAARTRRRTCASAAAPTTASRPRRYSARRTSRSGSTFANEGHALSRRRSRLRRRRRRHPRRRCRRRFLFLRLRRERSSSQCAGCTTWGSANPTRVER